MRSWTIAFALGVLGVDLCQRLPAVAWLWLILAVAMLLQFIPRCHLRLLGAMGLGVAHAAFYGHWLLDHRYPDLPDPREHWLQGQVVELPRQSESYGRLTRQFTLHVEAQSEDGEHWHAPRLLNVALRWRSDTPLRAGERWRVKAALERPRSLSNPGTFDFTAYQFAQRVSASGKVLEAERLAVAPWWSLDGFRQALLDSLRACLGADGFGRFAPALVLGVDDDLTAEDWRLLQRTGTVHLFVVSGLQIGIVAGASYLVVRRLLRRWPGRCLLFLPAQHYAALTAACMGLVYAMLAGFSLPTQRAAVIVILAALLPVLSRRVSVSHAACLALLVALAIDPLCLLFPSVWLSFGAAAVLVYGFAGRLRPPDWWRNVLKAQWVASLGMVPLLALLFGALSLAAPLANLIAAPVINLIGLPCAALAAIVSGWSPTLASGLWWPAEMAFGALWWLMQWLAEQQVTWWWTGRGSVAVGIFAVLGVLWALAPPGTPGRWVGLLLLLPACVPRSETLGGGEYRATVLDVGQGLAVYVETRAHRLLFDTGRRDSADNNSGDRVILPYLRARGLRTLDVLVLSHDDSDHTGGALPILGEMYVEQIFAGEPVAGVPATACTEGQHWAWDGVNFSFINPGGERSGNDASCVLRIEGGGGAMLVPGDISEKVELQLLRYQLDHLHADILLAPHHGSRSSSSARFAAVVAPQWVVYSAGHGNSYGHPHPQVEQRYRNLGAQGVRTDRSGAVSFLVSPGRDIVLAEYRQQARHYWE